MSKGLLPVQIIKCVRCSTTPDSSLTVGGPTSAFITENAVSQLVGLVEGRSHIRSLMHPTVGREGEENSTQSERQRVAMSIMMLFFFYLHLLPAVQQLIVYNFIQILQEFKGAAC